MLTVYAKSWRCQVSFCYASEVADRILNPAGTDAIFLFTMAAARSIGGRDDVQEPCLRMNDGIVLAVYAQIESAFEGRTSRRSEEHTSELQSLMRISYAVFCLKKKTTINRKIKTNS